MVDILLSIYNGERYLEELLESLFKQTYTTWRLLVRDDGSSDRSLDLIRRFIEEHPGKVFLLEDSLGSLGACQSFAELMKKTNANYVMFCDQDDVWLPNKINITLAKMMEIESFEILNVLENSSREIPLLVHTDLKVCDSQLNIISDSFWAYQKLSPEANSLKKLLVQNNVTGCTIMINRNLLLLSIEMPEAAIMHDYWLALVASAFGRVEYINKPTILYRQHNSNNVGAKKFTGLRMLERLLHLDEVTDVWLRKIAQAQSLLNSYELKYSKEQVIILKEFGELPLQGRLKRTINVLKNGFWMNKVSRNLGLIVILLFKIPKGKK